MINSSPPADTSEPGPPIVSTGDLPDPAVVQQRMHDAFNRYRHVSDGRVADYIPALGEASPTLFGIAISGVHGGIATVGDAEVPFSIQSVSKPFVFALVCQAIGAGAARERLGANSTGMPFDSVVAIEAHPDRLTNPMVNAGALATTSLVPGADAAEQWDYIRQGLSRFAGRVLDMDERVYASEQATNRRNQGIAHLLAGYGRLYGDPDDTVDVYTRQCSLLVCARDLAVMGATLADGGVNPVTGERVIDELLCRRVLAVLATAGLYERTGDWLYEVGLPGKSGVSGGMVTISPGKGGLGVFSPPLDTAGNSVRGRLVTTHLSESLGLNLFASAPPS
jgi:glutaminase